MGFYGDSDLCGGIFHFPTFRDSNGQGESWSSVIEGLEDLSGSFPSPN